MGRVIAIVNQKGGVGKSTTAVNLGRTWPCAGKRVLVVDMDPQGNATSGLGVEKSEVEQCMYSVLIGGLRIKDVIRPTEIEGLGGAGDDRAGGGRDRAGAADVPGVPPEAGSGAGGRRVRLHSD